jgi:glutaredoxin 3
MAEAPHKQPKVVVFSTPTCSWCVRLKTYFRQKKITFRDVNVQKDQRAMKDMVRRSGQQGVPQTWIGSQTIVGFDKARIDKLLNIS